MAMYFIDAIPLQPYSGERLVVVKGYTYDEVVDWFKNIFSTTTEKNLTKIREHYIWYNSQLESFKKCKSDIENGMDETSTVQGTYCSYKAADNESDFRLLILKKSLDFKNPNAVITVAHEVLHLCQEFLPTYLDRDEEHEAEAYFHTYIMKRIIDLSY
jgi:hypothetical protein